ncbi:TPA: hypothetical protein ACXJLS_000383 [Stenotrophomonas maltophilia]
MSRAKKIRQWLAENPGWHFMGDVCQGMAGIESKRVAHDVDQMARRGQIQSLGRHGTKRYSFGSTINQQEAPHAS